MEPFQSFWLGRGVLKTVAAERSVPLGSLDILEMISVLTGVIKVVDVQCLDLVDRR